MRTGTKLTKRVKKLVLEDMRILQKQLRKVSVYQPRLAQAHVSIKHKKRFYEQEGAA